MHLLAVARTIVEIPVVKTVALAYSLCSSSAFREFIRTMEAQMVAYGKVEEQPLFGDNAGGGGGGGEGASEIQEMTLFGFGDEEKGAPRIRGGGAGGGGTTSAWEKDKPRKEGGLGEPSFFGGGGGAPKEPGMGVFSEINGLQAVDSDEEEDDDDSDDGVGGCAGGAQHGLTKLLHRGMSQHGFDPADMRMDAVFLLDDVIIRCVYSVQSVQTRRLFQLFTSLNLTDTPPHTHLSLSHLPTFPFCLSPPYPPPSLLPACHPPPLLHIVKMFPTEAAVCGGVCRQPYSGEAGGIARRMRRGDARPKLLALRKAATREYQRLYRCDGHLGHLHFFHSLLLPSPPYDFTSRPPPSLLCCLYRGTFDLKLTIRINLYVLRAHICYTHWIYHWFDEYPDTRTSVHSP
jgi:hypothetical protein